MIDHSLYLALDFPSGEEALRFLDQYQLDGVPVKVGMELFYKEGPAIIEALKNRGHSIFLDLKLHDIPNTVKHAMKSLASLGVDVVNVHAAGGKKMIEAAKEGLLEGTSKGGLVPALLAVTQLTSTTDDMLQKELGISMAVEEAVVHYATQAYEAGADGVVCSVWEAESLRKTLPDSFKLLCPGIRLAHTDVHDQKRVATPKQARDLGVDAIVVGRSITKSNNPSETYHYINKEWLYVNQ